MLRSPANPSHHERDLSTWVVTFPPQFEHVYWKRLRIIKNREHDCAASYPPMSVLDIVPVCFQPFSLSSVPPADGMRVSVSLTWGRISGMIMRKLIIEDDMLNMIPNIQVTDGTLLCCSCCRGVSCLNNHQSIVIKGMRCR